MPAVIPKLCLSCGEPTTAGARCPGCRRRHERDRGEHRLAYRDPVYRSMVPIGECQAAGCDKPATTRDHIVPLILGGTNEPSNIRFLCRSCNSRKGARR